MCGTVAGYKDWNITFAFWVDASMILYAGMFQRLDHAKEVIQIPVEIDKTSTTVCVGVPAI